MVACMAALPTIALAHVTLESKQSAGPATVLAQASSHGHGTHAGKAMEGPAASDAWARATPGTATGAVFLHLSNPGGHTLRLVGVETPVAERAELHTHLHENGVMKMRQVEVIDVPAEGSVMFEPGGLHVMLFKLSAPLKVGDSFELNLAFEGGDSLTVPVAVMPIGHTGGGDSGGHGTHGSHGTSN